MLPPPNDSYNDPRFNVDTRLAIKNQPESLQEQRIMKYSEFFYHRVFYDIVDEEELADPADYAANFKWMFTGDVSLPSDLMRKLCIDHRGISFTTSQKLSFCHRFSADL
jgi:hypothetical protein